MSQQELQEGRTPDEDVANEHKHKKHKHNKKTEEEDYSRICQLSPQEREKEYIHNADAAWDRAWHILHDTEDWRADKGHDLKTGIVESKHYHGTGRCFRLQGHVDCSADKLFNLLVIEVETSSAWNPAVKESKVVQKVSENIDIHYTVTRSLAGGIIASRDYVNLRHWKTKDGTTLSGGCSLSHPDKPPTKKVVRGQNHPGGWVFTPLDGEPNRCLFRWVVNTEFGGWLPQWTVDQALAGELIKFLNTVRERVTELGLGATHS